MTYHEFMHERWIEAPWLGAWLCLKQIIVSTNGKMWQAKSCDDECPAIVDAIGCSGVGIKGHLRWVLWDLDVGHGAKSYETTCAAISDARRLREHLKGQAEIRLSKSGIGVHVKHLVGADELPGELGPKISKSLSTRLNLKACPAAAGRQCAWLWTRNPAPDAFKLIERHEGLNYVG